MSLITKIKNFFNPTPYSKGREFKRKTIADVKVGETIKIESHRILGRVGKMICLNNDIKNQKILLEVQWNNYEERNIPEYEKFIFSYHDNELKNFTLLNQQLVRSEGQQLSKQD